MAGYDVVLRMKIIKRWKELELQSQKAKAVQPQVSLDAVYEMLAQVMTARHPLQIKYINILQGLEDRIISLEAKVATLETQAQNPTNDYFTVEEWNAKQGYNLTPAQVEDYSKKLVKLSDALEYYHIVKDNVNSYHKNLLQEYFERICAQTRK